MTATAAASVRASEMVERLRRHYLKPGPMPGGVFIPEVGINGPMRQHRCDALYIGFTSASGRLLVGHEVKVSRADWRHELDQPDKADRWADQCHAWYVVAPSVEIVPPNELPAGWGLLTINPRTRTRLDVTVKAHVHEGRQPAWWALRSAFARHDTVHSADVAEQVRQRVDREVEAARDLDRRLRATRADRRDQLLDALASVLDTMRSEQVYVQDADLVTGLADLLRDRDAARQLHAHLVDAARTFQRLTDPFATAYGPLAKLAAEVKDLA